VLIVRLKQCEHAMADGRLDAAFELARAADLRADRRGQELVTRLAQALAGRGHDHVENGRIGEASSDVEKAAFLAGNAPEVASLRAAIALATTARQEADRVRGQAIAAARRHLDAGQLTVGAGVLATLDGADARARALKQEVETRRASLQSAIEKASAAFKAGDWESAVDHLGAFRAQFAGDTQFRQLAGQVTQHVLSEIHQAIDAGRLDRAASLLARLGGLGNASVELDQAVRTLQQCRLAFDMISATSAQQSLEILRRMSPLWPRARWMSAAAEHLQTLAETLEQLRSGPLALAGLGPAVVDHNQTRVGPTPPAVTPPPLPRGRNDAPAAGVQPREAGALGSKFLLHVDGVGSFQVISRPTLSIGAISSSAAPDIALLAGSGVATVTISRSDGDYVIQSHEPVMVNDKPTTGRLLNHGDKIQLGPRCRLTFRRPSAASGTAMLDLSGTRLPRDVRQIVLLDREIVIGPGAATHVRCDDLAAPAVLQSAGGRLLLRATDAVQVNGQPASKPAELCAGAHVRVGPLSFVVATD
jgi:hypothetical protein